MTFSPASNLVYLPQVLNFHAITVHAAAAVCPVYYSTNQF